LILSGAFFILREIMRLKVFICIVLAVVTLGIYWPARHFDFVFYDDPAFVMEPAASAGLSRMGFKWVLTGVAAGNWHPVTNLSFLMVHYFYGFNPGADHLFNVFVHAANAVLLFLVLVNLTKTLTSPTWNVAVLSPDGRQGESKSQRLVTSSPTIILMCGFVAGVFAWHPLRLDSVAWISERKDVLFVFFMLLCLWCYGKYTECGLVRPRVAAECGMPNGKGKRQGIFYGLALLFFALSLMSKAMVVTLPFLLLLLDFWPLGRFGNKQSLADSAADELALTPALSPKERGNRRPTSANDNDRTSSGDRNAKTIKRLVIEKIPFFVLTIVFSALTFWVQNTHAAVATLEKYAMWPRVENAVLSYRHYLELFFWPNRTAVMHLYPAHFDTTEVILTGLLLAAISALCILEIRRRPYLAAGWFWYLGMMVPVIGLVQVGFAGMADRYTYITMVGPTIALTWLAWDCARGKIIARCSLSLLAIVILAACVISTRAQLKFWRNSETLFNRDLAVEPQNVYAHFPMAFGLEQEGRWREAAVQYRIALSLTRPEVLFLSHLHLANYYEVIGRHREAVEHLLAALQLQPDAAETMNDLAWILATCPDASVRDGNRAVELAERACELTGYKETLFIGTLAAAYAEAGRFDDAVSTAKKAIANAQQNGETDLATRNQELLQLYLAHKTYRDAPTKSP
jgi:tetratricopeptide (TPR) repeat protein